MIPIPSDIMANPRPTRDGSRERIDEEGKLAHWREMARKCHESVQLPLEKGHTL